MTKAEEYRLRAKEAEEDAARCHSPDAKEAFLFIARQWQYLANQAEKHGW